MLKKLATVLCCFTALPAIADITQPADTARVIDLEEAVIVVSPKETSKLRQQPLAVSLLSGKELENRGIHTLKQVTGHVPNFFIPDYGSKLTSAVYIRGIGSRMNTPSVGLYVDNIPFINQSAFDFNFQDIDRIDVLRGPQGTLYGRNTMGGLLRVYTRDPLRYQGTEIQLGGNTRNGGRKMAVSTYQKIGNIGLSLSGFYEGNDGFFKNDSTGRRVDGIESGGGRLRLAYRANERLRIDLGTSFEYHDQGGYPYRYTGAVQGSEEQYPTLIHDITANRNSGYRRALLNTGLSVTYEAPRYTFSSVTGYQFLDDRMTLDQDFIHADIYTLTQQQRIHTYSQEFTVKSPNKRRWEWTTGVFAAHQRLQTQAPVTFYGDGINMLNQQIAGYLPSITMNNPMTGRPTTVHMGLALTDPDLSIDGRFHTPSTNLALFHQSTLNSFLLDPLSLTLGLRLDYEHQRMRYTSGGNTIHYNFEMDMISPAALACAPLLRGTLKDDYTQLLPKIALNYKLDQGLGNLYLTFSKGYRSGGYNAQNYSSLIQQLMQGDMMNGTRDHCNTVLQQLIDHAQSPVLKEMFEGIKQTVNEKIPTPSMPNVEQTVAYRPEYSWNYEAGAHLNLFDKALQADVAFFFMDTYDQQISKFADDGLGRSLVNAGHSHSCGAELGLRSALLDNRLTLSANYGFTHAVFKRYNDGKQDYKGNYVPLVPMHTGGFTADYCLPFKNGKLESLTFGADITGAGRIYWTEQNNTYQDFYATLGAHVTADFGPVQVNLWGKNLTCSRYDTFYFESMSRGYAQRNNPCHVGIDLRLSL